jgi:5-methylcytosine-specific restriction protein A
MLPSVTAPKASQVVHPINRNYALKPLQHPPQKPSAAPTRTTARSVHQRSAVIRQYVLARADGKCELCEVAAPFRTAKGEPYLEPHHIRRLSDGGPDDPRFMAALCPNCHRNVHFGKEGQSLNARLLDLMQAIE